MVLNMKKIFIFLFLVFTFTSYCQEDQFSSLVVLVTDEDSSLPISSCKVIIKESGWMMKKTNEEGRVYFDNSVPIGEINYIITKEGYNEIESTFNITTEEKSNTLLVKLKKIDEKKFRIFGEVTNEKDEDLGNVKIEIGILGEKFIGYSDDSGDFSIEIDEELKKIASEYKIEIKHANCDKFVKVGKVPQSNFLEEIIKINCSSNQKKDNNTPDLSVLELWEGKWMSTIMNMSLAKIEFKIKKGKLKGTYSNSQGKGTLTPQKITRNLISGKGRFRMNNGQVIPGTFEFHLDEKDMTFKGYFSNTIDNYMSKNSWDGHKMSD